MAKKAKKPSRRGVGGKQCLHCNRKAKVRGCCWGCYLSIRRDIRGGKYTDKQAIRSGRLLEPKKGGRPPKRARTMPPIVR